MAKRFKLYHGDCLEVLAEMDENSVDSIVTDPPYHLTSVVQRFGKPNSAPAKHGTDGLFARASRGFMGKEWDGGDISFRPETWAACLRVLKPGGHMIVFGGDRTYHRIACAIEDAGFEQRHMLAWLFGSGFPKNHAQDGAWEGWGTALKPGIEPIALVRKPFKGSVAKNLETWGVGALNIEGCRVPFESKEDEKEEKEKNQHKKFGSGPMTNQVYGKFDKDRENYDAPGRFPCNVMHDGLEEPWARYFYCPKASKADREEGLDAFETKMMGMSGGAQSQGEGYDKAQTIGLNRVIAKRNTHPTVKPTALMRYLCRLITPPNGRVLDPFMGSGSTGKAALLEGFRFRGIELEEEYFHIAKARIVSASAGDEPSSAPKKSRKRGYDDLLGILG